MTIKSLMVTLITSKGSSEERRFKSTYNLVFCWKTSHISEACGPQKIPFGSLVSEASFFSSCVSSMFSYDGAFKWVCNTNPCPLSFLRLPSPSWVRKPRYQRLSQDLMSLPRIISEHLMSRSIIATDTPDSLQCWALWVKPSSPKYTIPPLGSILHLKATIPPRLYWHSFSRV